MTKLTKIMSTVMNTASLMFATLVVTGVLFTLMACMAYGLACLLIHGHFVSLR